MKVTEFAVNHVTAVFVLFICLILGGLVSYSTLPREAAPDIPIPVVIVSTPYFGVSPADMETLVTQPMEKEFKGLKGLKKMTSTSAESVSLVTLEFETEIDIEEALQKVREKVDKVETELPPDAEDPEIIEINPSDFPVLIANVSGDMDPVRLKEIGESMKDDIEKISGVLRVDLAGGVEREIQVLLDPMKLRQYKVSPNQVSGAIQSENINLPGGSLEVGSMKYLLRVPGEFEDLETMRDIVVKAPQGQQVLLRDVAEVRDTYKEPSTYSRLTTFETDASGKISYTTQPNISLSVVKRSGENIIEIATAAKDLIGEYRVRMEPGVKIAILNDASIEIEASVTDLENNIISGMLLVLAVLFFFMGGARNATMVAVSVPLSMLISFIVLDVIGYTLNFVVLFSLMLALGMLVDNAIVIVENIYRHAGEGKPLPQAAIDGTSEVGWAVIASTATTVGAFFPMMFWPGVIGKFMGFLPATVIITLIASLFVALVINPAIAAVFLKVKKGENTDELNVPDNFIYRAYRSTLVWSLKHRLVVVVLSIAAFIGTFVIFGSANNGVEFFPDTTPELFTIKVEAADGTKLDATDAMLDRIVDPLDGKLDFDYGFTPEETERLNKELAVGAKLVEAWVEDTGVGGGGGGMAAGGSAPHYARISVDMLPADQQTSDPIEFMETLRVVYERVPGANIVLAKQSSGPPAGAPVNIEIVGDDLAVMARISQQIKDKIRVIPGIIDLEDDVELTRPEVLVRVDRRRAALAGTDTRGVASTVRTAVNGTKASVFREGDEEFDIVVKMPEEVRRDASDLGLLTVSNRDGFHIPLSEIADISVEGGTGSIRHKDQDRVVTVKANAARGYLPADLLATVQTELEGLKLPPGYEIRYTGENEDQEEAGAFLGRAMMLALFIIMLILVTQFNSISQPMIILSSVLLSLIGVLWSLILTGAPFGIIMTGIAVISLAGVVVNNSIVLIDYTNQLRARGLTRKEALINSGLVRFRPVLLTATTTILGLVPLVIGVSIDFINLRIIVGGRSVEMWGPMAKAISAGLLVATVLTLVVVPVLYSVFDQISESIAKLFSGKDDDGSAGGAPSEPVEPSEPALAGAPTGVVVAMLVAAGGLLVAPADAWAEGDKAPAEVTAPAGEEDVVVGDQGGEGDEFRTPSDIEGDGFEREDSDLTIPTIDASRQLDLATARDLVKENSYDVKLALSNIELADLTISKAYTTLFPTIVARATGKLNQREITANFGDIPGQENADPIIIQPQVDYNFVFSASMRLNAMAWPAIQQAYMNKELSEMQVELIRDELEFSVVQTYYNMLLTQRMVEMAAERLANERLSLRALEKRAQFGVARKYEVTRAKLRVAQAEQDLERSKQGFEQLRQVMAFLLQTEPNFKLAKVDTVTFDYEISKLKKIARDKRPSVRLQDTAIRLADKAREMQYWGYLPTLELTGTAFRPKDTAFNPGIWQLSLGVTAQWVLWDGGMREISIDESEAQLVQAQLRQRKTVAELDNQLDQAWSEYRSSLIQLDSTSTQVQLAKDAVTEVTAAFNAGTISQLDVIFAEDQLRVAELAHAQDELRVQLAIRKLLYLAGLD